MNYLEADFIHNQSTAICDQLQATVWDRSIYCYLHCSKVVPLSCKNQRRQRGVKIIIVAVSLKDRVPNILLNKMKMSKRGGKGSKEHD